MNVSAVEALSHYLASRPSELASISDDYSLVYSGVDFSDGESISLYVTRLGSDHFLISDGGLAADRLGDAGVDLSMRAARESWRLVTQIEAPMLADVSEFEVARTATVDSLGEAMWDVTVRCLQADGLRAIGKNQRQETFASRAIHAVAEAGLAVRPRAMLRNRFGGERQVHFQAQRVPVGDALLSPKRDAPEGVFVMTANIPGPFMESHDSVLNAFRGAEVDKGQRIAFLGPQARPDRWHIDSLSMECRVERVSKVEDFAEALA